MAKILNGIHYWTYGVKTNPTIVVIHGFRGTHHGLEYIIKHLKHHYVVVPDLPGFGDSPAFKNKRHTIEEYAQALDAFVRELRLQNPIVLGHSMGTVVAAEMIKQAPNLFQKAVLINPVAKNPPMLQLFPGYVYHRVAGKYLPNRVGTAILKNRQLFLLGSAVMTKTKDKELRKLIHWNHITYMKRFANRRTLLEAFESANITALKQYTDSLTLPVLMIAGKKDSIAPIKDQREVAGELQNATLVEFDNVGHIIHYEKPIEAAAAIDEFLKT